MIEDRLYQIHEAAQFLGFSVKTLQRWDRQGKFKPAFRTLTNRRVYTYQQLIEFLQSV